MEEIPKQSRRGIQFERVFRIAAVLQRLKFGATVRQIVRVINEQTEHNWHERTIFRDLQLLEHLGVVYSKTRPDEFTVFIWNRDFLGIRAEKVRASPTQAVLEKIAT